MYKMASEEEIEKNNKNLFTASLAGNLDEVTRLIKEGNITLDYTINKHRNTALHVLSMRVEQSDNAVKIAQLLIDFGYNINSVDIGKYTPIHFATIHNNDKVVKVLINNGAELNIQNTSGVTPLHTAINYGYNNIAELLLDNGADINKIDDKGWSPLIYAIKTSNTDIVTELLYRGAIFDDSKLDSEDIDFINKIQEKMNQDKADNVNIQKESSNMGAEDVNIPEGTEDYLRINHIDNSKGLSGNYKQKHIEFGKKRLTPLTQRKGGKRRQQKTRRRRNKKSRKKRR